MSDDGNEIDFGDEEEGDQLMGADAGGGADPDFGEDDENIVDFGDGDGEVEDDDLYGEHLDGEGEDLGYESEGLFPTASAA